MGVADVLDEELSAIDNVNIGTFDVIYYLFLVAIVLPSWAVTVRRLHDTNKTGWWLLIMLTIIGILLLLYWWIQKGHDTANKYGEPLILDQPTDA